MHPVVQINVSGTRFVPLDKSTRARSRESVRGFVILSQIRFDLDDHTGASCPEQLRSDQFTRTRERITLEKRIIEQIPPSRYSVRSSMTTGF